MPTANQLVSLLERHRAALPFADEELARHQALRTALAERHERSEAALSAWRNAISQRWECEVRAQRSYAAAQRFLESQPDAIAAYPYLFEMTYTGEPITPSELLSAVRRLATSLGVMSFDHAATVRADLIAAADALEIAIELTTQCENERRQMVLEERLTGHLYVRTCAKTHQLITRHFDTTSADS
jgi:hypothetical protein